MVPSGTVTVVIDVNPLQTDIDTVAASAASALPKCDSTDVADTFLKAVANSPDGRTKGLTAIKLTDAKETDFTLNPETRHCSAMGYFNDSKRFVSISLEKDGNGYILMWSR